MLNFHLTKISEWLLIHDQLHFVNGYWFIQNLQNENIFRVDVHPWSMINNKILFYRYMQNIHDQLTFVSDYWIMCKIHDQLIFFSGYWIMQTNDEQPISLCFMEALSLK